ncbi:hypothetical protein [Roseibium sp. SCP14]|uniref:hypothetical protein n=1 Tax=Roseibium sp. SCP14 TaxID=3141375 RepID=UPI00333B31D8
MSGGFFWLNDEQFSKLQPLLSKRRRKTTHETPDQLTADARKPRYLSMVEFERQVGWKYLATVIL